MLRRRAVSDLVAHGLLPALDSLTPLAPPTPPQAASYSFRSLLMPTVSSLMIVTPIKDDGNDDDEGHGADLTPTDDLCSAKSLSSVDCAV